MEYAWSGIISLTALSPQIYTAWILWGTGYALSKFGTICLMFIFSFIDPIWT